LTDPPYGSNVQYLELSHFWYVWNEDLYDKKEISFEKEAVVNRKKLGPNTKTYNIYENNLYAVFSECYRLLKPGRKMILTFNNKDLNSWLAVNISILRSGFHFERNNLRFQDGVSHYKTTAHTKAKGSPYGDFVYTFSKIKNDITLDNYFFSKSNIVDYVLGFLDQSDLKNKFDTLDRDKFLLAFFENLLPRLESYIRGSNYDEYQDIYNFFSKNQLKFLFSK
jgi:DNA modification methylase